MTSELQNKLRLKGYLDLGDVYMLYMGEWMLLKVGDSYLAHTEGSEPDILTVRRIEVQKRSTGLTIGKVFPKERKKKLYDLHEVVKIQLVANPNKEKRDELRKPDAAGESFPGDDQISKENSRGSERSSEEGSRGLVKTQPIPKPPRNPKRPVEYHRTPKERDSERRES